MATEATAFTFEASFDHESKLAWMATNWTLSIWISAFYLIFIFATKSMMGSRPGFQLQSPLIIWNLALAVFSIAGMCRVLPEMTAGLCQFGFGHSVCDPDFFAGTFGFWMWLFALSKLPELVDTVFLVLRKRPLHFLHWYHHVTVLCYSWYSYGGRTSTGRWFVAMNYIVHALMYTYYALKALRVRVPNVVSVVITTLQLVQMAVGCFINVWGYRAMARGEPCHVTNENLLISMLMYASYFSLFAHFFYVTYVRRRPKVPKMD